MDYPADATFYVRLSLVQPKEGADDKISAMQDDLLQFFATQPGYVRGYKLIREFPDPRIGRISVWQSEGDAENAAGAQHVLSVRSELIHLIEAEPQIERSYTAFDPQLAAAAP